MPLLEVYFPMPNIMKKKKVLVHLLKLPETPHDPFSRPQSTPDNQKLSLELLNALFGPVF